MQHTATTRGSKLMANVYRLIPLQYLCIWTLKTYFPATPVKKKLKCNNLNFPIVSHYCLWVSYWKTNATMCLINGIWPLLISPILSLVGVVVYSEMQSVTLKKAIQVSIAASVSTQEYNLQLERYWRTLCAVRLSYITQDPMKPLAPTYTALEAAVNRASCESKHQRHNRAGPE